MEKGETISRDAYIPNIRGQFRAKKESRSRIKHKQNMRIILALSKKKTSNHDIHPSNGFVTDIVAAVGKYQSGGSGTHGER